MKKEGLRENILKLRGDGLSYSEISKILKCSKSNISYYCKSYSLEKKEKRIKTKTVRCAICDGEFEVSVNSQKICCSVECKKQYKINYHKNRNYEYDKVVKWRIDKKNKAIEYKGGKCIRCGYNKCSTALEFHHLEPNKKDYSISRNINHSFDKIKKELDKCILVCANCHREIHEEMGA